MKAIKDNNFKIYETYQILLDPVKKNIKQKPCYNQQTKRCQIIKDTTIAKGKFKPFLYR